MLGVASEARTSNVFHGRHSLAIEQNFFLFDRKRMTPDPPTTDIKDGE